MLEVEHVELDNAALTVLQSLEDIYRMWQGSGRNRIKYYLYHST